MVGDLASTRVDAAATEPLDSVGHSRVQLLPARAGDVGEQRLPHEFMGEGEGPLRSFGARHDYSHLLRLIDDVEKFVNVDFADVGQKLKTETSPDNCGGGQRALFILGEPLQPPPDNQAHVFWNIDFVDRDISAEFAVCVEDFPVFDQMPINFLDEKWISLTFLEDCAHQAFRRVTLA